MPDLATPDMVNAVMQAVWTMREEGMTTVEIARRAGSARTTITRWLTTPVNELTMQLAVVKRVDFNLGLGIWPKVKRFP